MTSEAPQDVAALLREVAEAATKGPWRWPVGGALIGAEGDVVVELGLRDRDARYIAAANPTVVLGLLDQNDRLRSALHSCGLAAHFGGELMDQRHRGGRDKLRYIEITADAALRGVPPVFPSGAEEAARNE